MTEYKFTAQIEQDKETGMYVAYVPNLPGAHTQAKSLDELHANLIEVVELCLQEMSHEEIVSLPEYIGAQQITIAV